MIKFLLKTLTVMLLLVGLAVGGLTALQMRVEQKSLNEIINDDVNGIKRDLNDFAIEINNQIALALDNN